MGLIPQVGVLKVGVLDVQTNPFAPQGGSGSWDFLLTNGTGMGEVYGECISAFPIFFSVSDAGAGLAQLFSGFLLGIVLCLSEDLLCLWKEVKWGGSCLSILGLIVPIAGF